MSDGKPPYMIPPVGEIVAHEGSTGLTAASTFSGAGGSGLGLRWAGWSVPFASEFVPAAQETYRANFPGSVLDTRDIRELDAQTIIDACGGAPDVLEGSPPCSPFSASGRRTDGWGEVKAYSDVRQRVDDLFDVWIALAERLRPRALLAENVPGLLIGKTAGAWKRIVAALRRIGYLPQATVLDASWLGVPQARRRLIIVAFREDQVTERKAFAWPTPLPYRYAIADAIPWVEQEYSTSGGGDLIVESSSPVDVAGSTPASARFGVVLVRRSYAPSTADPSTESSFTITTFDTDFGVFDSVTHDPETGDPIGLRGYAIFREWERLARRAHQSRYLNLRRDDVDGSVSTVTQAAGRICAAGVTRPLEPRKFTLVELRRLCGFPDDFILTGSFRQRWERLGRAVPPPVFRAVGRQLAAALGGSVDRCAA